MKLTKEKREINKLLKPYCIAVPTNIDGEYYFEFNVAKAVHLFRLDIKSYIAKKLSEQREEFIELLELEIFKKQHQENAILEESQKMR